MPLALATGMGSTFDCADHSKSVCFLVRSTISGPVRAGFASVVVIIPLYVFSPQRNKANIREQVPQIPLTSTGVSKLIMKLTCLPGCFMYISSLRFTYWPDTFDRLQFQDKP